MRQLVYKTNPLYVRPTILINHVWSALIDTGADIPVSYLSPEVLQTYFDAKSAISNTEILTVGHKKIQGDVYIIPVFTMGDLTFPRLPVFVPILDSEVSETEEVTHFIISASMLYGMRYEFDTKNHVFTITVEDSEIVRHPKILIDGNVIAFENISDQPQMQ